MKTLLLPILRPCAVLVVALFMAGCEEDEAKAAQSSKPPPVVQAPATAPTPPPAPTAAPATAGLPGPTNTLSAVPAAASTNTVPSTNAQAAVLQKLPPKRIPLPPLVDEVVTMSEAGIEEAVLLAYVEKAAAPFELGVEEILYLNDLGIPSPVVAALVRKSGPGAEKALAEVNSGTAVSTNAPALQAPTNVASAIPQAATVPPASLVPPAVPTAELVPNAAPPPAPEPQVVMQSSPVNNYYYFQESLSPYGTWVEIAPYGWCWQPTVAVVDSSWRPYCHRGRWVWSDCGWYWQSDYSWGWAPFHYGRWHRHPYRGWLWTPDTVWGPAWVSWRQSDSYCGWAPLPPEAHYRVGVGFSYRSSRVGVGFDFGLGHDSYIFVGYDRFHDRNPHRYLVPRDRHETVYSRTTVINNYVVGNNNVIVNQGVGRDRVAAVTRTEIRKVSIQDVSPAQGRDIRPDRLSSDGSRLAVYRPKFEQHNAAPVPVAPPKPGREEGSKPRQNEERTVWAPAGSPGGLNVPIRPRNGAASVPAVAPAPAPSAGSNPGKRPESGRNEGRVSPGRETTLREPVKAPSVQPRNARPQPGSPSGATEPKPSINQNTPSPMQRSPNQGTPAVTPLPAPARQAEQPKPSQESRPGIQDPRGASPTAIPQPRSPTGLQRPTPQATPNISTTPGSISQPRFQQPIPSATVITRPQAPRVETPKPPVTYQSPAPSYREGSSGPSGPGSPSIRQEGRGRGWNPPPSSRPNSYSPPSPAPSRIAPAPSAPSSIPQPAPSQGRQGGGSGNERGRKSDVN